MGRREKPVTFKIVVPPSAARAEQMSRDLLEMVMKKEGITDVSRVGLYGLTYKEDVDDMRESPTLQMLECMERHLAGGRVKVYDPYIEADVVANQYHGLDAFLEDVDLVVVMAGHEEIRKNGNRLKGKIVLDTKNIYAKGGNIYHL